ncbi:hypothetical protein [Ignicoccus hospitalis]|uniref:hypothetical protein n=1 Tax=Ignicoccus hospitalis TaxID=160233 RepID=UPI000320E86A|nr:hypothetical protein [Ignicoccus hospitalis]HIH90539.1 hypothetical protein [Desulfurococcaceae archaeon]
MKYCPRCKSPMELNIEKSVSSDGTVKVLYFYRCKACGYRLEDAVLLMKKGDGGYEVKAVEYLD